MQAQGCSNGTDTQFGKAYGFCWLVIAPLSLHIDKELYPCNGKGAPEGGEPYWSCKFSCICRGHPIILWSRVVRSSFLCRCRGVPYGGGYIGYVAF
ncbi:MAG: hypothetical protein ACLRX7_07860 [Acutalibacteraceae bacterium]